MEEVQFSLDSPLEGEGFELSVPRQRISVYRVIRSVAARDRDERGIGTSERTFPFSPVFVKIMPLPPEALGAPFCCSPVDPEDDE